MASVRGLEQSSKAVELSRYELHFCDAFWSLDTERYAHDMPIPRSKIITEIGRYTDCVDLIDDYVYVVGYVDQKWREYLAKKRRAK